MAQEGRVFTPGCSGNYAVPDPGAKGRAAVGTAAPGRRRAETRSEGETDGMETELLTHPTVKAAVDALQKADKLAWAALFEPDAKLYDDGRPRSLEKFTRDSLGHERFISIDRVENGGLDVFGAFHSDKWGNFRTYFKFQLSPSGGIKRLDIGQVG